MDEAVNPLLFLPDVWRPAGATGCRDDLRLRAVRRSRHRDDADDAVRRRVFRRTFLGAPAEDGGNHAKLARDKARKNPHRTERVRPKTRARFGDRTHGFFRPRLKSDSPEHSHCSGERRAGSRSRGNTDERMCMTRIGRAHHRERQWVEHD